MFFFLLDFVDISMSMKVCWYLNKIHVVPYNFHYNVVARSGKADALKTRLITPVG